LLTCYMPHMLDEATLSLVPLPKWSRDHISRECHV
jgi:hypothetical protein